MLDQQAVDHWLQLFLERLRKDFDGRLRFVGHHGSWARGEPRPESDIDAIVILDTIDDATLRTGSRPVKLMTIPGEHDD